MGHEHGRGWMSFRKRGMPRGGIFEKGVTCTRFS
jgi:hypothetical protein